jgi:RNase P/RNase MRP subunit p30
MDFDLFVLFASETDLPDDSLRMTVDRMIRYGWNGIVLTRSVPTVKRLLPPPSPVTLSDIATANIERRYGLCVLGDYPAFPQFTRLNLVTGDVQEVHLLTRELSKIRYDLISVTPLSDDVFRLLCSTTDIDLITLDVSKYLPKKCWKELKAAVNRDVGIEFVYSQFLGNDWQLKNLISACQSVVHATRGRNAKSRRIFLSFGSDEPGLVRTPSDVRNFARLVGIPDEDRVTGEVVKEVLARGMARKTHAGAVRRMRVTEGDLVDDIIRVVVDDPPATVAS